MQTTIKKRGSFMGNEMSAGMALTCKVIVAALFIVMVFAIVTLGKYQN